jgi:hypothetical protein
VLRSRHDCRPVCGRNRPRSIPDLGWPGRIAINMARMSFDCSLAAQLVRDIATRYFPPIKTRDIAAHTQMDRARVTHALASDGARPSHADCGSRRPAIARRRPRPAERLWRAHCRPVCGRNRPRSIPDWGCPRSNSDQMVRMSFDCSLARGRGISGDAPPARPRAMIDSGRKHKGAG